MAINRAERMGVEKNCSQNPGLVCPHCQAELDEVTSNEVKSVYRDNYILSCSECKKIIIRS